LPGFDPGERPQEGQPFLNWASSPIKLQAGQRIEAKDLPHLGQFFEFPGTSAPQFSQKKRGLLSLRLKKSNTLKVMF